MLEQMSVVEFNVIDSVRLAMSSLDCWFVHHRMGSSDAHKLHGSMHRPCQVTQSMFFFFYPLHYILAYAMAFLIFIGGFSYKALKVFGVILSKILKRLIAVLLYITALSNSELCYLFYGDPEFFTLMTSAGVYVEDIPQFIIQLSYSVIMSVKFKQVVSPFQWISFALTFWHFGFSGSWKYITFGEPPPPRWDFV